MIISDLSHLNTIFEDTAIMGGTGLLVTVEGTAEGESTDVSASTTASIKELPHDGFIAHSRSFIVVVASDPVDATATVNVSGEAEATKTVIKSHTRSVDSGSDAIAFGHIIVHAITPPSPN
ncbi:hypothetical protein F7734_47950 [Scytonema sp. UIC 10036]|uniref:hypothetical protein n=1 Tax=Scytonema sp. UIC 10036 TaxID=2304196 RepID=UPI0012DA2C36|nr:hypothetical protein [Scytonema sp. UIC 10036]MUG99607.1 hypothetical protein [Scytonema sp. UIC 10036]